MGWTILSVYLIAKINIFDRETYAKYEQGFMPIFEKYEGRMLSVDENPTVLEGSWPSTRTVISQFKDREAAMAWYNSDEYQELMQNRLKASEGDIIITQDLSSKST